MSKRRKELGMKSEICLDLERYDYKRLLISLKNCNMIQIRDTRCGHKS